MTSGTSDVKDGMDMTLVCIDKEAQKLSFAGARNPLYFLRNGQLQEIKATKMSVGYNSKQAVADFVTASVLFGQNLADDPQLNQIITSNKNQIDKGRLLLQEVRYRKAPARQAGDA